MEAAGKKNMSVDYSRGCQQITFSDSSNSIAHVVSKNVLIIPNKGGKYQENPHILLKDLIDYSWDVKYKPFPVAFHIERIYVAYIIETNVNPSGIVKVVNIKTGDKLHVNPPESQPTDIAFACIRHPVLLAIADKDGDVFIHNIQEGGGHLVTFISEVLIHIKQTNKDIFREVKIVWCPYIPEEDPDPNAYNPSQLVGIIGKNAVQLWDIDVVRKLYTTMAVTAGTIRMGFVQIEGNEAVTDACFSPDGSTIGLILSSGTVRFFQINMGNTNHVRLLHEWVPHNGQPINMLYFLDDQRSAIDAGEQVWKYAVTATKMNSEIKLWSCESWKCLQEIRIKPDNFLTSTLVPYLDLSASFLTLFNKERKVLIILHIDKKVDCSVDYVCEFSLPEQALNLIITDTGFSESEEELQPAGSEQLKLLLISVKSVQECYLRYNANDATKPSFMYGEGLLVSSGSGERFRNGNDNVSEDEQDAVMDEEEQKLSVSPPDFVKVTATEGDPIPAYAEVASEVSNDFVVAGGLTKVETDTQCSYRSAGSSTSREVEDIFVSDEEEADRTKETAESVFVDVVGSPTPNRIFEEEALLGQAETEVSEEDLRYVDSKPPILDDIHSQLVEVTQGLSSIASLVKSISNQNEEQDKWRNTEADITEVKDIVQQNTVKCDSIKEQLDKQNDVLMKVLREFQRVRSSMQKSPGQIVQEVGDMNVKIIDEANDKLITTLLDLTKSSNVAETVCNAMVPIMLPMMKSMLSDFMLQDVLPRLDANFKGLFKSLNDTFVSGSEECMFEALTYMIRKYEKVMDKKIQDTIQNMSATQERLLKEVMDNTEMQMNAKMEVLTKKMELSFTDMAEQQNRRLSDSMTRSSRASSPEDEHVQQYQLLNLVKEKKLDAAFRKALSYHNDRLLLFLCRKLRSHVVFADPNSFKQQTLLNLVEQLSGGDWTTNLDLKCRYMQCATMILNKSDPAIKDALQFSVPMIKERIKRVLTCVPQTDPNYQTMKILLMALDSLIS